MSSELRPLIFCQYPDFRGCDYANDHGANAAHLWPELDVNRFDIIVAYWGSRFRVMLTTKNRGSVEDVRLLAQIEAGSVQRALEELFQMLGRHLHKEQEMKWYSQFRPGGGQIAMSKALEMMPQSEPPSYSSAV